jgi:hypothetical protein
MLSCDAPPPAAVVAFAILSFQKRKSSSYTQTCLHERAEHFGVGIHRGTEAKDCADGRKTVSVNIDPSHCVSVTPHVTRREEHLFRASRRSRVPPSPPHHRTTLQVRKRESRGNPFLLCCQQQQRSEQRIVECAAHRAVAGKPASS